MTPCWRRPAATPHLCVPSDCRLFPLLRASDPVHQERTSIDFHALKKPGAVTITATVAGGTQFSTTLTIKLPTSISQKKLSEDDIPLGKAGVGMWSEATIKPTDVSFSGLLISETPCPAVDLGGIYAGGGPVHNPAGNSGVLIYVPPDARSWIGVWDDNREKAQDHSSSGPYSPPFQAGGFTWHIPWVFKLATDTSGLGQTFTTAHARHQVEATGKATVSKKTTTTISATRAP